MLQIASLELPERVHGEREHLCLAAAVANSHTHSILSKRQGKASGGDSLANQSGQLIVPDKKRQSNQNADTGKKGSKMLLSGLWG
jgi:hypothetical protein